MPQTAAQLLVACLQEEGVEVVFGIPGEENIHFVDALNASSLRFVLVRHEQGASFMAEMYGRVTQRAAVCTGTLGPGAINMQLGVADAQTNSTPLVAISAQVGRARSYKESHQGIDLVAMFAPITKRAALVPTPEAIPELVRQAFKTAQTERPGAVYLAVPEDIESGEVDDALVPLHPDRVRPNEPSAEQVARAADALRDAKNPIILVGHGVAREGTGAVDAVVAFAEHAGVPVATTFHGKGAFPEDHPLAIGTVGFMTHDYANFGFDAADLVLSVGFELQEFDPRKINPDGDKAIIHLHRHPAEVDAHYPVAVGLHGSIARSLELLRAAIEPGGGSGLDRASSRAQDMIHEELENGATDDRFPVAPQRVVAETRAALGREDVVLVDTGAVKMWMARLYPTYAPNTCLISNGLSTMGFSLPGAIGVKIAQPERRVLVATGDGAFLMNVQELETAVREGIAMTVLVWEDDSYGLIEWKMEMDLGHASHVRFENPDVVKLAESFGAVGIRVGAADELAPALRRGLEGDGVTVISCPVDYAENLKLTERLGQLEEAL